MKKSCKRKIHNFKIKKPIKFLLNFLLRLRVIEFITS